MKPPPKSPLTQLQLPLLAPSRTTLPAGKDEQLIQALIELLWSAAVRATAGSSRDQHES